MQQPPPDEHGTQSRIWECRVCLHLHEGDEPPPSCPICGAPASEFLPAE
ncbi:MAG: hypothetical protein R6X25_09140 [Candidatus Krumholzibacteriia bacterium]